jgi:hypothetical protein
MHGHTLEWQHAEEQCGPVAAALEWREAGPYAIVAHSEQQAIFQGSGGTMRHVAIAFVLALVVSTGAQVPAHAQSVQELAKSATSEAKRGNHLEAYNTIRKAALRIWEQGPLLFREALFVKAAPTGYGIYDPRPNTVFKPGEKLFIYVEPVGFTWKKEGGLNHAELVSDLILKDSEGKVLGEQAGFGTFTFNSRDNNMEVMTSLTIDFTEAPVGKYMAELKFTDKLGDKSASFELPFEIKTEGSSTDEAADSESDADE